MRNESKKTVIPRHSRGSQRIVRESVPDAPIRDQNEVQAAYSQVGRSPNRNVKSWYRDIYEFYQNNEY